MTFGFPSGFILFISLFMSSCFYVTTHLLGAFLYNTDGQGLCISGLGCSGLQVALGAFFAFPGCKYT